jgi:hypothetical protein
MEVVYSKIYQLSLYNFFRIIIKYTFILYTYGIVYVDIFCYILGQLS